MSRCLQQVTADHVRGRSDLKPADTECERPNTSSTTTTNHGSHSTYTANKLYPLRLQYGLMRRNWANQRQFLYNRVPRLSNLCLSHLTFQIHPSVLTSILTKREVSGALHMYMQHYNTKLKPRYFKLCTRRCQAPLQDLQST